MPILSVIIPVYNTAKYLAEALDSILEQGIEDMEVICVNDGSTDDSLTILERYSAKDKRIKIYSQENKGQSVARNTALEHAAGEYIYFMDSDDVLKDGCFNQCIMKMEEHNYDFVFFDADVFCEEGTPGICWDYSRTNIYEDNKAYNGPELMHSLLDNYTHRAVPWLLFVRHSHLKKLGLSFYPGIIHEDELFTTLLTIQSTRIGCIKSSFVKHRVRNNSTMSTHYSKRNVDCYITVVDELSKWGQDHLQYQELIDKYARYTLDKVFYTAHVLTIKQKCELVKHMYIKKYTKYVSKRNWIRFLVK